MVRTLALFLISACVFPISGTGQDCDALRSGSVADARAYLQQVRDRASEAPCVQMAFHQIASLPSEQAIPILIKYLGYKRPLNEGERHGIFAHGNSPNVLYPAVHELYRLGTVAEPGLLKFVGEGKEATPAEVGNALYTLLLIHHGDAVGLIESLTQARKSSEDEAAGHRLEAAARDALRWCDERARTKCERALQ